MPNDLFSRIDTVFLPVRYLEASLAWYQDVLGWVVGWRNEGAAALSPGSGAPLVLIQVPQFEPRTEEPFSLFAPDLEAAHTALETRGITVTPIAVHGKVRDFQFTDPDGNVIGVVWWPEG